MGETLSTSTSTELLNQKARKKILASVNNTANKLILDKRSCKKVTQKVNVCDPVYITSGISEFQM